MMETIKEILEHSKYFMSVIAVCSECKQKFECVGKLHDGEILTPLVCGHCQERIEDERAVCDSCGAFRTLTYNPLKKEYVYQCQHCTPPQLNVSSMSELYGQRWQNLCPPYYRNFRIEKMLERRAEADRRITEQLYKRVVAWSKQSPPTTGLLLRGSSDEGKTFFAYQALRTLVFRGYRVTAFECDMFGKLVQNKAMSGDLDLFIEGLLLVDVLMFDDLGKSPLTPRVTAELFAVIERRAARDKATVITTNETSETLAAKLNDEAISSALNRRLSTFFEVIEFPLTEKVY